MLFKAAITRGNWVILNEGQLILPILSLAPSAELLLFQLEIKPMTFNSFNLCKFKLVRAYSNLVIFNYIDPYMNYPFTFVFAVML